MTNNNQSPLPATFDVPHDEEVEKIVIGSVLITPSIFLSLVAFIKPDHFYLVRHQYIWQACTNLMENGEPIERVTLRTELEALGHWQSIGGDTYLSTLMNSTPSAVHAEVHARILERYATRRSLIAAANQIKALASDKSLALEEVINSAERELFEVAENRIQRDVVSMREAASDYFEQIEKLIQRGNQPLGLPTGFKKLDALLGGLQKSDLMIFAGRPGMGKTSFLLTLAMNAATLVKGRVAIFTLEMGVEQMLQRMVSMETGINMQKLRTGGFDTHQYRLLVESINRLSTHSIFIDDSPSLTPLQLRTKCQRLMYEHGVDLIIVDYLQLMNAGGAYANNRVQEISYISRQLKELARELNVPLLSAAQLSRAVEQRQDKRPQLSDLRESGSIEQDADIVMFLYRDVVYNEATENPNQADIIVAKHRNGPTDTIPLYFDASITKFVDGTRQNYDLSRM